MLLRLLVLLCWQIWACFGDDEEPAGVIRSIRTTPPGCQLQPSVFDPQKKFYVVECPYQAKEITLSFSSAFPLTDDKDHKVESPTYVQLRSGEARPIYVKACNDAHWGSGKCTRYVFDVHRQGSSEATLARVDVVGTGGSDVEFIPPFSPAVTRYVVRIPFSTSAEVTAQAMKDGFVSLDSYESAIENMIIQPVELGHQSHLTVNIYVVSSDSKGRAKYVLDIEQKMNMDAELSALRSNVGIFRPPLSPGVLQYRLEVPKLTRAVAISAAAHDRKGALVTVHGSTARGYSSALVDLPAQSPYALVHITVRAADGISQEQYVVVVMNQGGEHLPMLEKLEVGPCVGGLRPPFRMFRHNYRCNLDRTMDRFIVIPTGLWMPGDVDHTEISIYGKNWPSGDEWKQPLDDWGHAEVRLSVTSVDGSSKATYVIKGMGYPLAERRTTTTTTTTTFTTTTMPFLWYATSQVPTVRPLPGYGTIAPMFPIPGLTTHSTSMQSAFGGQMTTTTVSVAPSTVPWWQPPSWSFPRWHVEIHPPDPRVFIPSETQIKTTMYGLAFTALLACEGLASCMAVLKHLQFIAFSAEVVPSQSRYWNMSHQLGVFNLWWVVPGIRAQLVDVKQQHSKGNIHTSRRLETSSPVDIDLAWLTNLQRRIGLLVVFTMCLPILILMLVSGYIHYITDEAVTYKNLLSRVGIRSNRLKALPSALVILDIGILSFTDALTTLLYTQKELEIKFAHRVFTIPHGFLWALLIIYPMGYSIFCGIQLIWLLLEGRLQWSSVLGLYADAKSLAVALRGPWFTAWSTKNPELGVLGWLCAAEYRSVVPLSGLDSGPLRLADARRRRMKIIPMDAETAELEAGLLRLRSVPAWQRRQKQLALLNWMERRCAIYSTIKQQITEADRFGVITDVQGNVIHDIAHEPLFDMYQYCVYQFPRRPWLKTMRNPVDMLPGQEPIEVQNGRVFAPWVPKAADISRAERKRINAWLDEWLLQAEIVERTREELRLLQLRGYDPVSTQGEQAALLREMAISLLDGAPLRSPLEFSSEEAEDRDTRCAELVQERELFGPVLPWESDVGTLHEAPAIFCTELINTDEFLQAMEAFVQPAFSRAAFAYRRLHIRTIGEDPSDMESGVASTANVLTTRVMLAICPFRLPHVHLLAKWMPPFSFSVPHDSLRMPVRENWVPLFASAAVPGASRDSFLCDVLERMVSVAAVFAFRRDMGEDVTPHNINSCAFILATWTLLILLLRRLTRPTDVWPQRIGCAQLILCMLLVGFRQKEGEHIPMPWSFLPLETVCISAAGLVLLVLCAYSLQRFVMYIFLSSARKGKQTHIVDELYEVPKPIYGTFYVVGGLPDGRTLPFGLVVPFLGLFLPMDACRDPGACTDENRSAACQKRLAVYEGPPTRVRGFERPVGRVQDLRRFVEIRDIMPVVASRAQLAGTEELRELVCTIHVVNHAGCAWSSLENDSYLSLFKPWGLESRPMAKREVRGPVSEAGTATGSDIVRGLEMTEESPVLIKAWRKEVTDWLYGELAATGSVEYTALDVMLDGGRADRNVVKQEGDRRVVPGIFSDDGLGAIKYSESRSFVEGRVLHYVILSDELKAGLSWRPDPLATHEVELRTEVFWRPALLRLASRGITYLLKKADGTDYGGPFPAWGERVWQDHGDHLEYNVSFLFVERVIVDEEQGTVTFHGRDLSPGGTARPGVEFSPRYLPLVFNVGPEMAEVWDYIVKQYGMSSRLEHIINYSGPVIEHPHIPGVVCRHGPEGEQLWDDGKRYVGPWSSHVYHGHGELLDARSDLIFRGQWQRGMKHGEGTFFFAQAGVRKVYTGDWVSDEFSGAGELRVADESIDELRRTQPYGIVRFRGQFNVASGQFLQPPDLMQLEPEKHSRLIQQYFPLGPSRSLSVSGTMASTILEEGFLQFCGAAPRDFAAEFYGLDGNDVRHCGPDPDCEILYADGCIYRGPCRAAAIPDGLHGLLVEPNGTQYEGPIENGVRKGAGRVTLANGITYEGQFLYPGGLRHGNGHLVVPAALQAQAAIASYDGQYSRGLREGEGEVTFADLGSYQGEFLGNLRHGSGTLVETDNTRYEGPWEGDLPGTGWADIAYNDGHRYLGDVSGARRHGEGELHAPLGPRGTGLDVIYSGQWVDDLMSGEGTLNAVDGTYKGQFKNGVREGRGRFEYKQALGHQNARSYEGAWEKDQPNGNGDYSDEYGYENLDATFLNGEIISERRPVPKGFKEKYRAPRGPSEFARTSVEPVPAARWPMGSGICTSRGRLTAKEPPALDGMDSGVGLANARIRAAHMGFEGVPGSRWA